MIASHADRKINALPAADALDSPDLALQRSDERLLGWKQRKLVITPEELARLVKRGGVVVIDLQAAEDAREHRIAGARHVDLATVQTQVGAAPDMLLGPDAFARAAAVAGIEPTTEVVLYDGYDGRVAARAFWMFERYGHRSARVLAGGLDEWTAAGLPTDSGELVAPPHSSYVVTAESHNLATFEDVVAATFDPSVTILDARSAEEFARGAVPGAVSLDFTRVIADPATEGWLRSPHELRALFGECGVWEPSRPVIVYCHAGTRSSVLYLALRSLGYDRVYNYDGSWVEWEARRGRETLAESESPVRELIESF